MDKIYDRKITSLIDESTVKKAVVNLNNIEQKNCIEILNKIVMLLYRVTVCTNQFYIFCVYKI